jgi:hypothetical protein
MKKHLLFALLLFVTTSLCRAQVNIIPQSPVICAGSGVNLKAIGATSYTWTPSTGLSTTTGDSVVAYPIITTIYTVTGTGSGSGSTTDTVIVNHSPGKPVITEHDTAGLEILISSATHGNQWLRNDTVLIGDTNQTYTVTIPGYYLVRITGSNGCSITSDSLTPPDGIKQLVAINNQLSISPNPTSGQFTIKLNGNQNGYTVEVYNEVGEKIEELVLSSLQNTIDLQSQPDGMYFVYLKSEEGVMVGKVMVTK